MERRRKKMYRLEVVIILQRCISDVVFSKALQSSAMGVTQSGFSAGKKGKEDHSESNRDKENNVLVILSSFLNCGKIDDL